MENIKLYQHQKDVLEQCKDRNRVAFYLDMGLGKTFCGSEKMMQLKAKVNLVVCQKSQVDYWVNHIKKYYATHDRDYCAKELIFDLTDRKQLERFIYESNQATRVYYLVDERTGEEYSQENLYPYLIVGVINYDKIWRRPELLKLKDFTLLLDESSLIQNETSKRSRAILKLKCKNVILLSGTPVGGKYEKAWSQMKLLGWNISKKLFWNHYVVTRTLSVFNKAMGKKRDVKIPVGYKNEERLKAKMREYGCQFLKTEEVFDLPSQQFIEVAVKRTKDYNTFVKKKVLLKDDIAMVGDNTLSQMLYQRMLCGSYNHYKKDALEDLLAGTSKRVIVFYNFKDELKVIEDICVKLDKPLSIVNGSIKDLSVYEEYDDSVTAIQYQAGSMGLNLQKANVIIYFTPPLSSEHYEQSKKRIHRIGQTSTCFYYNLIVKGSIEEKIYNVLAQRKDFTERLFENK